uniref:Thioredoxin-like fold domain-containing protein n=1 Tax=Percolomonas cosmopolitus TaxID=63605 RepID=A0A7S1KME3_9EUKA
MAKILVTLATLFVLFLTCTRSQLTPVPKNQFVNGLVIGNPSNKHHLHFTFDLTCVDCASWYRTKGAAILDMLSNSSQIYGTINVFPLPYHIAAFDASMAALLVREKKSNADALKLYGNMFQNQQPLSNARTAMLTRDQIRDSIYKEYLRDFGISENDWKTHYNDVDANLETRAEFKFACYQSITGTPFFQANGVVIPDGYDKDAKAWIAFFSDLDNGFAHRSNNPIQM